MVLTGARREELAKLLPFQKKDFYEFFQEMHGNPVTIRTIDPPLHEFLPSREDLMVEIAVLKASKSGDTKKLNELETLLERDPASPGAASALKCAAYWR